MIMIKIIKAMLFDDFVPVNGNRLRMLPNDMCIYIFTWCPPPYLMILPVCYDPKCMICML